MPLFGVIDVSELEFNKLEQLTKDGFARRITIQEFDTKYTLIMSGLIKRDVSVGVLRTLNYVYGTVRNHYEK